MLFRVKIKRERERETEEEKIQFVVSFARYNCSHDYNIINHVSAVPAYSDRQTEI